MSSVPSVFNSQRPDFSDASPGSSQATTSSQANASSLQNYLGAVLVQGDSDVVKDHESFANGVLAALRNIIVRFQGSFSRGSYDNGATTVATRAGDSKEKGKGGFVINMKSDDPKTKEQRKDADETREKMSAERGELKKEKAAEQARIAEENAVKQEISNKQAEIDKTRAAGDKFFREQILTDSGGEAAGQAHPVQSSEADSLPPVA